MNKRIHFGLNIKGYLVIFMDLMMKIKKIMFKAVLVKISLIVILVTHSLIMMEMDNKKAKKMIKWMKTSSSKRKKKPN